MTTHDAAHPRPRLLVTGARDWTHTTLLRDVLRLAWRAWPGGLLVHGDARGVDTYAADIWHDIGGDCEAHPIRSYPSPRARNQAMVNAGATACLAFATRWDSGTGMCARMARRAGIPTYDYGTPTIPKTALSVPVGPWGTCPHCGKPIRLSGAHGPPGRPETADADEAAAFTEWGPA